MNRTVVDLFAGPGGLDEGLRVACPNAEVVGIEHEKSACETAISAGHRRTLADVREHRTTFLGYGGIWGLLGSPPCPGFSNGGRRRGIADAKLILALLELLVSVQEPSAALLAGAVDDLEPHMSDPRSTLVLEPLIWALQYHPEWIVFEQVPPVRPIWELVAVVLRGQGYHVVTDVVRAEQYGVPQVRRRAVLLASRVHEVKIPAPTHAAHPRRKQDGDLPEPVSMADALGWGMTHRPYVTVTAGISAGGHDPALAGGSGARALIQTERDAGRWKDPEGHPWLKSDPKTRRLTVPEAATLQSFRDLYPWKGLKTQQFQQIANAVPPLLAEHLIREVI